MKIIFKGETKRVPNLQSYYALQEHVDKIFNLSLDILAARDGLSLKMFYMDEDGDVISVTCQSDLDEAYLELKSKIKLCLANNHGQAKDQFITGCVAAADSLIRQQSKGIQNQSI